MFGFHLILTALWNLRKAVLLISFQLPVFRKQLQTVRLLTEIYYMREPTAAFMQLISLRMKYMIMITLKCLRENVFDILCRIQTGIFGSVHTVKTVW